MLYMDGCVVQGAIGMPSPIEPDIKMKPKDNQRYIHQLLHPTAPHEDYDCVYDEEIDGVASLLCLDRQKQNFRAVFTGPTRGKGDDIHPCM